MDHKPTRLLLNIGHAIDHGFLLIFATAVTSIALEFGIKHWEDLMPYSVAAFFFFGIGSLPAGKLGDLWGRRPMMIVFFIGMGLAAILVSLATTPLQIAVALALLGCIAAIYHPVAIPMLVAGASRPGWTIGVNGLAGNLGVALAAALTGLLVKYFGWRAAFFVPGVLSLACGLVFAWIAPRQAAPAAKKKTGHGEGPGFSMAKLFLIMTIAATNGSLLFNFATSSNYEMLASRFHEISHDPAQIGLLLALVYGLASLMQLVVGSLIDRMPMKALYLGIIALQTLFLLVSTSIDGWVFYAVQILFMATIFGSVPFTDAMIVRYVDDGMRSRVTGMRLTVSLGASSLAVWLIGPVVKQAGFTSLLWLMTIVSTVTFLVISNLPRTRRPSQG